MKTLAAVVGGALGIVLGLLIAGIIITIQGGVCSVPWLNLTHCYGLGTLAVWEQVIMLFVGAGIGASVGASTATSIVSSRRRDQSR